MVEVASMHLLLLLEETIADDPSMNEKEQDKAALGQLELVPTKQVQDGGAVVD